MRPPGTLSDERYADQLLRRQHDVFDQAEMETYFRKAAHNWRVALRFGEATRVENRIKELQKRTAQDWPGVPVVDLSGLPDQRTPTPLPSGLTPIPRTVPAFDPSKPFEVVPPGRINKGARNVFDEIERLNAEYNGAIERGDLGAMKRAESQLRALGINPTKRK